MARAFVAVGSNIDAAEHLRAAAAALRRRFADAHFSACYRNPAFGFEGPDFINAVVGFSTELSVAALLSLLRAIEQDSGRQPSDPQWGSRAIDLDLLLYDQLVDSGQGWTLPRPDLKARVYMLGPLAELAPQWRYPPAGPSIAELWRQFPDSQRALLQRIELDLNLS